MRFPAACKTFLRSLALLPVQATVCTAGVRDSLVRLLAAPVSDTLRIRIMVKPAHLYPNTSLTPAIYYSEQASKLAINLGWNGGIALARLITALFILEKKLSGSSKASLIQSSGGVVRPAIYVPAGWGAKSSSGN